MTTLPGYHLSETLYQGTRTLVYRATRISDNQPVVIKFLRNEYPTVRELVQLRNQYTIAKNLDLPGIVQPLALETHGNGYALVMSDEEYISLGEWQREKLSISDFLLIAIQLADILYGLYRNRVIHKDIKPANILIHPETKHVKLIDFSISSLLPKETQEVSNPNVLEGTLAYISPEQTGRMNRGIDYRTDFYSLGVTFYELLTGELPFQSDDPMELVHCHIAKSPMALGNGARGTGNGEEIPQVLSQLVLKLMAKNAEDRYQSALGLKYDLEKCRKQWKETGEVAEFELGKRDICDRFTIPEKLYGRESEVETLLAAFERVAAGNTELMLVAGFSGIGKTAVVNEVHKPIVRQRGYFIKGKFDQFNRNIPLSAFVQALRDLLGQLRSESDAQLQIWRSNILDAVGENGQVLIEVIPELVQIIGPQPPAPELSSSAAQNRFNLLFQNFIEVFTTAEHPLVLFLDDLQWADSASLELIELLMNDHGYLLILGAYRDNEVYPAHPLMLTLDEIQKNEAIVHTITLTPLTQSGLNHLVAETLSCSLELAVPLTELVYQKTKGNPFFATQFLKSLNEGEWISYNSEVGYWECDLVSVRQLALTDDVVEFMATQLQKLPTQTQQVLKLAACIGNQFDLETLAIVSERSQTDTAMALWKALQEGLVLPTNEVYKFYQSDEVQDFASNSKNKSPNYKFLHDRVQQASYSLIPEEEKQKTHLNIGRLLLQRIPESEREEKVFKIVNHLNRGCEIIATEAEKENLAKLNLIAGQKAKLSTAFLTALEYGKTGIKLLSSEGWKEHYALTCGLHQMSAEAAYGSGEFEIAATLIESALNFARALVEKAQFYQIKIDIHVAQNNCAEAIEVGREILKMLGVEFPESVTQEEIQQIFSELVQLMPEGGTELLLALPTTTDPVVITAMQTLVKLGTPIFTTNPGLFPLISANVIKQTLKHGTTSISSVGYSHYSLLLAGMFNDLEAGYQFGELALQLIPRFNNRAVDTHVWCLAACSTHHWKIHLKKVLPFYDRGAQAGLEVGELPIVGLNYVHSAYTIYLLGAVLTETKQKIEIRSNAIRQLKQENLLSYCETFRQCVLNLLNLSKDPCTLTGEALNEEQLIAQAQENQDTLGLFFLYFCKLQLFYLLGSYDRALTYGNLAIEYSAMAGSFALVPVMHFYTTLTRLALYNSFSERDRKLEEINIVLEKFELWSGHCAENFQHKYDLLEAEKHRVLGEKIEAIELYDRAISGAKANEYLQEEALANELAAKFYLDWGKEKIAQTYMVEAYYCYARWGAKAKTDHIEATYPQLLAPILQQSKSSLPLNATLTAYQTLHTSTNLSTSLLDVSAAIKASQALSGEIELEALLAKLMQIVLENAGADKGALILNNSETWEIATQCVGETCQLSPIPLESSDTLPLSLVRTVQRTRETIVLNQVAKNIRFAADSYLIQQQPKSLFCKPILNQGQLIGILYLENNLSEGAFTTERFDILNLLCSQASISIENARLYRKSQDYAKKLEGTVQELQQTQQQLQKSFEDLKQAQLQMVQSEKMSALGNLVAGVAHEINNPVGFIGGNLQPARDYVQDLLGLIDLYQEENPTPSVAIEEEIEAIDLEFLREDLPKLIDSMKLGVGRIAHISTSLRTFSRTDKEYKVSFNLHDGIDSTLLILKHRLRANEQRPKIKILKEYGNIPEVQCFPGQLNQVFMNLIANAIDALDQGNAERSFEEIAANPNRITISTEATSKEVTIRISDNGVGMSEKVKRRIFEQGFTTKGVGKGTGLGMAIARQIVEEKHDGIISCTSKPGTGTEFTISLPLG